MAMKNSKLPPTKPQLSQPRTVRPPTGEIIADLLGIPPLGERNPWANHISPSSIGLTMSDAERIVRESASWPLPGDDRG